MNRVSLFLLSAMAICFSSAALCGCGEGANDAVIQEKKPSLPEARASFRTSPNPRDADFDPVSEPPAALARIVHYDSPVGKLPAYLTLPPPGGERHPAIVWIHGGPCNSIHASTFEPREPENDQTGSAFWRAGIVTMYPSLRGGNDNPRAPEGFFGEVDDVIAAAKFLASQDFVDGQRIYLGGHSTGGTLALLVAESTDTFRAVFSFGPVANVAGYPPDFLPFNARNPREIELRSPIHWLHSIRRPTFAFEGVGGNEQSIRAMAQVSSNSLFHGFVLPGADHFSILSPVTALVAQKIVEDRRATDTIAFTEAELNSLFGK
jgi:pimeloyl-ACP methyl ester carboxylesterase